MKTLSTQTVMRLANCSKSTAIEIVYSNLLETKKLYLNKKNNSTATKKWLVKNFDAKFTEGNDAPRGGKTGDFVTFTVNDKFDDLVTLINNEDVKLKNFTALKKIEQQEAINSMVITEEEKTKFLEKTKNMSNRQARQIAHNYAGKKLGFYSNLAKDKFMDLRN